MHFARSRMFGAVFPNILSIVRGFVIEIVAIIIAAIAAAMDINQSNWTMRGVSVCACANVCVSNGRPHIVAQ
jgi:hypothetical protein